MGKEIMLADKILKVNSILNILVINNKYFIYNIDTNKLSKKYDGFSVITENLIVGDDGDCIELIDETGEIKYIAHKNELSDENGHISENLRIKIGSLIDYNDLTIHCDDGVMYEIKNSSNSNWTHDITMEGDYLAFTIRLNGIMTLIFNKVSKKLIRCYAGYADISAKTLNYVAINIYDNPNKNSRQEVLNVSGKVVKDSEHGAWKAFAMDYEEDIWYCEDIFKIVDDKIIAVDLESEDL